MLFLFNDRGVLAIHTLDVLIELKLFLFGFPLKGLCFVQQENTEAEMALEDFIEKLKLFDHPIP